MKPELVLDINWSCDCPKERTDNLPPCGQGLDFKRPDGFYCDCGHETDCCKKYGVQDAFNKKYGRMPSTNLQPTGSKGNRKIGGIVTINEKQRRAACQEMYPERVRIIKSNPYGLPIGREFPHARRKEGNASPFPIEIYSYAGDYSRYQMKEDEVEILFDAIKYE